MADVTVKISNPSADPNLDNATIENIATEPTLKDIRSIAERIEKSLKSNGIIVKSLKQIAANTTANKTNAPATSSSSVITSVNRHFQNLQNTTDNLSKSFDFLRKTVLQTAASLSSTSSRSRGTGGSSGGGTGSGGGRGTGGSSGGGTGSGGRGGSGSGTGSGTGGGSILNLIPLLSNLRKLHPGLAALYVTIQAVSSAIGAVVKMISGFVASGIKMVTQFIQGENKLSAYVNTLAEALSSIPLIGGLLGGLVGIIAESIKTLEHWRDVQNQLADVGAAFNQDLYRMRDTANLSGLELDKFASIVSKNSENLSKFGTVTTGALQFSKVVKSLRTEMQGMGYSLEDVGEGVAQTFGLLSTGLAARTVSEHELINASRTLMKEFDAVAKLTGKSRKSQEELIKKQTMNAAFQLKLSRLGKEEQSKINAAIARVGEEAADDFKTSFLGMAPAIKSVAGFRTLAPQASQALGKLAKDLESGSMSAEEFEKRIDDVQTIVAESSIKAAKDIEPILAAGAAGINSSVFEYTKSIDAITVANRQFIVNGKYDRAAHQEYLKKMRDEQKERSNVADSLSAFEKLLSELRVSLYEYIIKPLYDLMGPMLSSFIKDFKYTWAPKITEYFKNFGEKIGDLSDEISVLFDGDKVQATFLEGFELLIKRVSIEMSRVVGKSSLAHMLGFGYDEKEYQNELALWRTTVAAKKSEFKDSKAQAIQELKNKRLAEDIDQDDKLRKKLELERAEKQAEIEELKSKSTQEATDKINSLSNEVKNLDDAIQRSTERITKNTEEIKTSTNKDKINKQPSLSEGTIKLKEKQIEQAAVVDEQSRWQRLKSHAVIGASAGAGVGAALGTPLFGIGALAGGLGGGILGGIGGALEGFFGQDSQAEKLKESLSIDKLSKEEKIKKLKENELEIKKLTELRETAIKNQFGSDSGAQFTGAYELEKLLKQNNYIKESLGYTQLVQKQDELADTVNANTNRVKDLTNRLDNTSKSEVNTINKLKEELSKAKDEQNKNTQELKKVTEELSNFGYNVASPLSKYKMQSAQSAGEGLAVDLDRRNSAEAASNRLTQLEKRLGTGSVKRTSRNFLKENNASSLYDFDPKKTYDTEAVAGGEIQENTVRVAEKLAQFGTFTAFNDAYHKLNKPDSKHASGRAFDMVLKENLNLPEYKSWKEKDENKNKPAGELTWVKFLATSEGEQWIKSIVSTASGDIPTNIINEYDPKKRSSKSTAPHLHVELRKFGSIGMTGKAFENFGSGTMIQAHDLEGIFTPNQLKSIVNESQQRLSNDVVDKVSTLIKDTSLQKEMVSLLSQVVDALNKSNRINNTIANNI